METEKPKKELKEEIIIPENITVEIANGIVTLKSEKGELKRDFSDRKISMKKEGNKVIFDAGNFSKAKKKVIKTYAAHLKNMANGVTNGHKYVLKICSGHFPMNVSLSGKEIIIKNFLGEKVPRKLTIKEGAKVKINGDHIEVESLSKETAGQVSADIEEVTKRAGFDTRIFQDGIYIINKDGKEI